MSQGLRRKAREAVIQALYLSDVAGESLTDSLEQVRDNFAIDKRARNFAAEIVRGLSPLMAEIDGLISERAENWRIDRMAVVDRNILRLAVYELRYRPDIPATVAINEALEIARRFTSDDAVSFINGILDPLRGELGRND